MSLSELVRSLGKFRSAVFVRGDPGVASLLEQLTQQRLHLWRSEKISQADYKNPHRVFVRFRIDRSLCSGLVQASSQEEALDIFLDIQFGLHKKEAEILTLLRLPVPRIRTFPFFVICEEILRNVGQKLAANYWPQHPKNIEAIRAWLVDFLCYRREIIRTRVPELEPVVPSALTNQRVLGLYDPSAGAITLRYYRSMEDTDIVDVREERTETPFGPHDNKLFEELFDLPPQVELLREVRQCSGAGRMTYREWGHPYFVAADELRQHIERYNRYLPGTYQDATYVTDARLYDWTSSEIRLIRELSQRFPEVGEHFRNFMHPVEVIHVYQLDEPRETWIRNGSISIYYMRGPADRVSTIRLNVGEEFRHAVNILENKFGLHKRNVFLKIDTHILWYLRDKADID